jgi:N-acetylmuramic acid 6-phosphate (MurNAc-6-P) etherase
MPSVSETLRRATLEADRALSAEDRVLQALRLGDSDLELALAASGRKPDEVRAQLVLQRQAGRRPCRCALER